jgi:hypothetical protein
MNIAGKLQGIGIFFHQNRPIPPLKKMPHSLRLYIKVIGITGVQMMDDPAKICPRGLQKQMIMIRHKTKTMDFGSISFCSRFEVAEKSFVISFCSIDRSPLISPGGDMVEGIRIFNPQRSCHTKAISNPKKLVKSVDLTPILPLPTYFFIRGHSQMTLLSGYSMIPTAPRFNNFGMSSRTTFSETITSMANQSL